MPQSIRFFQAVRQGWLNVLDLLYPRLCNGCDAPLPQEAPLSGEDAWFCPGCREGLQPVLPPFCTVCAEPFSGAMTAAFKCSNCQGRRIAFDFAIAAYQADGPLREMIHRYKYGRQLHLRAGLADLLRRTLSEPRLAPENLREWLLVPVPLHFVRQQWRGFNQSWELCRELSRLTGIPAAQILRRRRRTSTQARLHRQKRLQNLRQAIALRPSRPWHRLPSLAGRRILLVDDVLTTGATAHECAKVLKQRAGVEKVVVLAVGRG